jgi:hypothetical protein
VRRRRVTRVQQVRRRGVGHGLEGREALLEEARRGDELGLLLLAVLRKEGERESEVF